ncbi:transcriptional regulator [Alloalcanivorax xenomutans]|uniref:transcriptional regulator n=1 Tax=Alloalcanivorax xenomutans TaxID=1094342 RepID=UPI00047DA72F
MHPIKRAAEIAGGTQKSLAERLGVDPSFVSQWISGIRKVPASMCQDIEDLTNGAVRCDELRPDVFRQPKDSAA